MSHDVRLSPHARHDISRLAAFLAERDPRTTGRARAALYQALISLQTLPERGRSIDSGDLRELRVKFGRYGYVMQYRVEPGIVFVARIFHVREQR